MANLYAATNGLSLWTSSDNGDTINRMPTSTGLYSGAWVWGLAAHPTNPNELLVGTNFGVYKYDQKTKKMNLLNLPMENGLQMVTACAYHPSNPDIIVVGTQPGQLFRTADGGKTWTNVGAAISKYAERYYEGHWTRVTCVIFDPKDGNHCWAGVEIDGVWHSSDAGLTWTRVAKDGIPPDIHGFGITHIGGERRLFAATNKGAFLTVDNGNNWEIKPLDSKYHFIRSVVARPDGSGVMFECDGDGPPGTIGELHRSRDHGKTWEKVELPGTLESSMYFVAVHPSDPKLVFAACNLGQLFRSTDGGETWTALKRRLPEIRALAWLPDAA